MAKTFDEIYSLLEHANLETLKKKLINARKPILFDCLKFSDDKLYWLTPAGALIRKSLNHIDTIKKVREMLGTKIDLRQVFFSLALHNQNLFDDHHYLYKKTINNEEMSFPIQKFHLKACLDAYAAGLTAQPLYNKGLIQQCIENGATVNCIAEYYAIHGHFELLGKFYQEHADCLDKKFIVRGYGRRDVAFNQIPEIFEAEKYRSSWELGRILSHNKISLSGLGHSDLNSLYYALNFEDDVFNHKKIDYSKDTQLKMAFLMGFMGNLMAIDVILKTYDVTDKRARIYAVAGLKAGGHHYIVQGVSCPAYEILNQPLIELGDISERSFQITQDMQPLTAIFLPEKMDLATNFAKTKEAHELTPPDSPIGADSSRKRNIASIVGGSQDGGPKRLKK